MAAANCLRRHYFEGVGAALYLEKMPKVILHIGISSLFKEDVEAPGKNHVLTWCHRTRCPAVQCPSAGQSSSRVFSRDSMSPKQTSEEDSRYLILSACNSTLEEEQLSPCSDT
jgi:hypothetical protein